LFRILLLQSTSTTRGPLYAFYMVDGEIYESDDLNDVIDVTRTLMQTHLYPSILIIDNIEFEVDILIPQ